MREIKFRCFSKPTKRMNEWNWLKGLPFSEVNHDNEEYFFMQYTGLKDSNGKEIYEDDLVEFLGYGKSKIGKIIFNPKKMAFMVEGIENYLCFWFGEYDEIKVVGNVYENPEIKTWVEK